MLLGESAEDISQNYYTPQVQQIQVSEPNPAGFGTTVTLTKTGGNSYRFSSSQYGDKELVWDSDADSYYDADSDCWLWYNTDVSPALWQYWYEGISSDFEEGWMEHDSDGWFIEESAGNWIELPGNYDTSVLWYIEGS